MPDLSCTAPLLPSWVVLNALNHNYSLQLSGDHVLFITISPVHRAGPGTGAGTTNVVVMQLKRAGALKLVTEVLGTAPSDTCRLPRQRVESQETTSKVGTGQSKKDPQRASSLSCPFHKREKVQRREGIWSRQHGGLQHSQHTLELLRVSLLTHWAQALNLAEASPGRQGGFLGPQGRLQAAGTCTLSLTHPVPFSIS